MIYTLTLNPSIDQHIKIKKLVKDDTLKAESIHRDPGGKGINVSRVIKELGGDTKAFTLVGGCAGYMLRDLLDRSSVPFEFIEVLGETRINVIMTDLSDCTQTRISAPGPKVNTQHIGTLLKMVNQATPRPSFWVLGGSLPPGISKDTYKKIIDYLQSKGEKCVLDADGEALELGIQASPFLIKPNEFELERLLGREIRNEGEIVAAGTELCRGGVGIVAVSLGKKGAIFITKEKAFKLEAPAVEVRTKIGAGDSMIGGFLTALENNKDIETAARYAVAAGTAAVMREGTELCSREDVEKVFDLVTAHSINDESNLAYDVICGMTIEKSKASGQSRYKGKDFYFCSLMCREKFDLDPERYLNKKKVGLES